MIFLRSQQGLKKKSIRGLFRTNGFLTTDVRKLLYTVFAAVECLQYVGFRLLDEVSPLGF